MRKRRRWYGILGISHKPGELRHISARILVNNSSAAMHTVTFFLRLHIVSKLFGLKDAQYAPTWKTGLFTEQLYHLFSFGWAIATRIRRIQCATGSANGHRPVAFLKAYSVNFLTTKREYHLPLSLP